MTTALNLAGVLANKRKHDLDGAEALTKRALEVFERTRGFGHPSTMACLINLAQLLTIKDDLDGAEALLKRGVEGSTRVNGARHPHTKPFATRLRDLLQAKHGKRACADEVATLEAVHGL